MYSGRNTMDILYYTFKHIYLRTSTFQDRHSRTHLHTLIPQVSSWHNEDGLFPVDLLYHQIKSYITDDNYFRLKDTPLLTPD